MESKQGNKSPSDVLCINQAHSREAAKPFFLLTEERKGESKADLIKFKAVPQWTWGPLSCPQKVYFSTNSQQLLLETISFKKFSEQKVKEQIGRKVFFF